ncbi:siderophore ABC transporter substrate-binding protein [Tuberibacillus sp. Marseille-P3662]|uniref:siderophore ABC transporter substrate-binding protein n=1 Tax=Tuberibacillus sp. Marseille-P3662 TaxID=1965358 RepID=UPI000A1C9476|nr:siderophore ABC transporter substrate-binding protein [Tuberibacillus sp. Marseille-P3662]
MKKTFLTLVVAVVLAMVVTACGSNGSSSSANGAEQSKVNNAETLTVQHELGTTKVKKNPDNVVVFDFGALDSLNEMNVDVAGVAKSSLPPYLSKYDDDKYANVGSLKEPDFEKINELNPGLIIISGRQSGSYEELSKIAPTIYVGVDNKNYMTSFKKNMRTLGKIFDKTSVVKKTLGEIDSQIQELKAKASTMDKKGLIVLTTGGKMSAYGPGSRFGIIHDVFGVKPVDKNIKASTHGQKISSEYISEKNPDYLFVIDRDSAIGRGASAKKVIENALVKKTNASKSDHIVYLNPNYWYLSGGGLASVQEMVKEIDKGLE